MESPPLDFPRRFSRYSTLEEARASTSEATRQIEASHSLTDDSALADDSIKYLMLCRVAMGKTERASTPPGCSTTVLLPRFSDYGSLVGTLLIPDEVMGTSRKLHT